MIRVKEQRNARTMLRTKATRLGSIGDDTYFVLDGKVWRGNDGIIFRSDDPIENETLLRLCREVCRKPLLDDHGRLVLPETRNELRAMTDKEVEAFRDLHAARGYGGLVQAANDELASRHLAMGPTAHERKRKETSVSSRQGTLSRSYRG
jgi:hypothetical protein